MKLWIARDKCGFLGLYKNKPKYLERINLEGDWYKGEFMGLLDSDSFPQVTFDNSPMQVELKLIKTI